MSAAKIKRGTRPKPARRKQNRAKTKVGRASRIDRLLKALPLSDAQLQRLFTWTIMLVLFGGLLLGAELLGLSAAAQRQFAESAGRAGFEVKRVEVSGIERVDEMKVYEIVLAEKNRAMPLVDLARLRRELIAYSWIRDARVTRRLPDTLVVEIIERKPGAVWKYGDSLSLIDENGVVLEKITPETRPDLPMLVGRDANRHAAALRRLLDAAPALEPLIVSAGWIGNRRWNLEFRSGETLALPEGEANAARALVNFARMEGVNRLLGRGIEHFDFRDPDRAYLRMPGREREAERDDG